MIKEKLDEKMVHVNMVSDGVMEILLFVEEIVLRLIFGHTPQSGISLEKRMSS